MHIQKKKTSVGVPGQCCMLQSFIYFPGTSLWLFIHATYMALLYLFWKSIKIEHFKHDFFIESSNWMAYVACCCEHFVRCKNTDRIWRRRKTYLQPASNRWIKPWNKFILPLHWEAWNFVMFLCCKSWCDHLRYVHLFHGLAPFVVWFWVF